MAPETMALDVFTNYSEMILESDEEPSSSDGADLDKNRSVTSSLNTAFEASSTVKLAQLNDALPSASFAILMSVADQLSTALKTSKGNKSSLICLDLSGVPFSLPMVELLSEGLKAGRHVERLVMKNCDLGSACVTDLLDTLSGIQSTRVELAGNLIRSQQALCSVRDFAKAGGSIRFDSASEMNAESGTLSVSGSCCNGALAVISGLVCALSPSTIDWSNATISDSVDIEGLKLLSGDLSSSQVESYSVNNSTVKLVDVCQQGEFIGSVIASSSAAALVTVAHLLLNPSNASLTSLNLSGCNWTPIMAHQLFFCMRSREELRHLNLSNNALNNEGCLLLAAFVKEGCPLSSLDISSTKLTTDASMQSNHSGIYALTNALKLNSSITKVSCA